jgi:hypothetical protein
VHTSTDSELDRSLIRGWLRSEGLRDLSICGVDKNPPATFLTNPAGSLPECRVVRLRDTPFGYGSPTELRGSENSGTESRLRRFAVLRTGSRRCLAVGERSREIRHVPAKQAASHTAKELK